MIWRPRPRPNLILSRPKYYLGRPNPKDLEFGARLKIWEAEIRDLGGHIQECALCPKLVTQRFRLTVKLRVQGWMHIGFDTAKQLELKGLA